MRVLVLGLLFISVLVLLAGCATSYPVGSIYTKLQLPVDATGNMGDATKVGKAESMSILALVAIGDSSINTAKKNGNISKIHYVDWDVENILGIIGRYKVTVYGE